MFKTVGIFVMKSFLVLLQCTKVSFSFEGIKQLVYANKNVNATKALMELNSAGKAVSEKRFSVHFRYLRDSMQN